MNSEIEKLKKQSDAIEMPFAETENRGESAIKHPFDPTKIDIRPQPLTISSILKRLESTPMRIKMDTEFQRKANLWSNVAQSRLIESLLVRIPLPAFYFDATEDIWLIVDGLQRISTLKNFIIDKSFKLEGLEYLKDYEGYGWDNLPEYLQARIEETPVTAYIINPGTPYQAKFNIFKRINTGGLVLTPQEIRHALNQGTPAKLVADLAKMTEFIDAMGGYVPSDRMEDRDYTTRFLAFYLDRKNYAGDLDEFLNEGMALVKDYSDKELIDFKERFKRAMMAAKSIFGKYAFRKKFEEDDRRRPVNKALFECVSVALASLSEKNLDKLIKLKQEVDVGLMNLLNEDEIFLRSITSGTGDNLAVSRRHDKIMQLFKSILND